MTAPFSSDSASGASARLIAVVDDDYRVLESLEDLLQSVGYRTRQYSSAEDFLRSADRQSIDLLITDIGLPGMSGIELLRTLRHERLMMPAILITARSEMQHQRDAGELVATLFAKPFDSGELLRTIHRKIGLHDS